MDQLLEQLIAAAEADREVVYCRLVETRGSTPQKPGAAMLVYADGSQFGTLGGGCVEAEVKRRALATLGAAATGQAATEIARFTLDHDYGWDDGLICGGRMQVLVRPVAATDLPYFRQMLGEVQRGDGVTEAVLFGDPDAPDAPDDSPDDVPHGEMPAAGTSYLLDAAGTLLASLPADAVETPAVQQHLKPLQQRPRPYNAAGVAYLPSLSRCRLVIVGGGHVGQAVANLATQLDFDVWIVDDREDCISSERFPTAQRRIHGVIADVLPELEITPQTYCLIVTRGHNHDQEALYHLVDRGARYVGMIGSRRKIRLIFDNLQDAGIAREALDKVYAPLGIDIGSQTVPEIAVSICAELIAHRNLGRVPGRAPFDSARPAASGSPSCVVDPPSSA